MKKPPLNFSFTIYHVYFIILPVLCSLAVTSYGQAALSTKSNKAIELYTQADNYRVRGQFKEAINLLNQALAKDKNFAEAYYRLGLVYFSMRQFNEAILHFEKGLSLTSDPKKQKVYWYDLGESYLNIGAYEKAVSALENFSRLETQNKQKLERAQLLLRNAAFAQENIKKGNHFKQRKLSDTVNSFAMQYFPALTADQQELIFTRRLGNGENDDEDLVVSRKNSKGQWTRPVSISDSINSILNEGTCTISADGRLLIFTSCSGRGGYGSCDLYQSRKIGDTWTKPKNLGNAVNTADWESQPSLSADGRSLYFVSDRRGGYGRRDIWVSHQDAKGNWVKAENAGKQINTRFDEISPFIHVNNRTLYFASNGLTGFGGYDLFYVERDSTGWSRPTNVGAPINTHEDQFALFITADGKKGYYAHEEMTQAGYPAGMIYEIEIPAESQIKFRSNYVKGIVRDKHTGKVLSSTIELINLENNEIESVVKSDSLTGQYLIVLTQGAEYALYVNKSGYLFKSLNFNYSTIKDFEPIILNIELEKINEGVSIVLNNLFFDTDKYELKPKSKTELNKVIKFMNDNPQVKVEISGHTDNVGSSSYNQSLSEKRAQAVYTYLTQQAINSKRLSTRGYGASRPIADNETEEGRQRNRRIEFQIIQ